MDSNMAVAGLLIAGALFVIAGTVLIVWPATARRLLQQWDQLQARIERCSRTQRSLIATMKAVESVDADWAVVIGEQIRSSLAQARPHAQIPDRFATLRDTFGSAVANASGELLSVRDVRALWHVPQALVETRQLALQVDRWEAALEPAAAQYEQLGRDRIDLLEHIGELRKGAVARVRERIERDQQSGLSIDREAAEYAAIEKSLNLMESEVRWTKRSELTSTQLLRDRLATLGERVQVVEIALRHKRENLDAWKQQLEITRARLDKFKPAGASDDIWKPVADCVTNGQRLCDAAIQWYLAGALFEAEVALAHAERYVLLCGLMAQITGDRIHLRETEEIALPETRKAIEVWRERVALALWHVDTARVFSGQATSPVSDEDIKDIEDAIDEAGAVHEEATALRRRHATEARRLSDEAQASEAALKGAWSSLNEVVGMGSDGLQDRFEGVMRRLHVSAGKPAFLEQSVREVREVTATLKRSEEMLRSLTKGVSDEVTQVGRLVQETQVIAGEWACLQMGLDRAKAAEEQCRALLGDASQCGSIREYEARLRKVEGIVLTLRDVCAELLRWRSEIADAIAKLVRIQQTMRDAKASFPVHIEHLMMDEVIKGRAEPNFAATLKHLERAIRLAERAIA